MLLGGLGIAARGWEIGGGRWGSSPTPNPPLSKTDLPVYSAAQIGQHGYAHSLLSSGSRGVFGIPGLRLRTAGSDPNLGYLVSSMTKDVKLDSGIQLLLQVNGPELQ